MNKKALYESIMSSVAKEVKKALLENEKEYASYHDAELDAIHYNELPDEYKSTRYKNEEYILSEKMSRTELIDFIGNVDWDLLAAQHKKFWPDAKPYFAYIQDNDLSMDGGIIYAQIPYSEIYIEVEVKFDWDYVPYDPGDYWTPPYGGFGRLRDCKLVGITVESEGGKYELTKDEITSHNMEKLFCDVAFSIGDNMDQDDEYFHSYDDDAYDRWKDEQW